MIFSRSIFLVLSAGLLGVAAAADLRRMGGRRHLQYEDANAIDAIASNATDVTGIADDAIEEDKRGKDSSDDYSNSVARDSVTYQYLNSKFILKGLYGSAEPMGRSGKGITFTEALRYEELSNCFLTPIRDDLELLQVKTVLQTAKATNQVPSASGKDFAWVGVSKDAMLTVESPIGDTFGKRLCRAGSWKNLFDGSDLGGYETNFDMESCPTEDVCPGGCWLGSEDGKRADILKKYWWTPDTSNLKVGEPNNKDYNRLQTKVLMNASNSRLHDAHESQIDQATGAMYMCKLE